MQKIQMTTPLVEMDGDEMTRIVWKMIKDNLLSPYIDLKTEYYDLGLEKRDETDDRITIDAAEATKKYGVAVKCATITPNAARVEEYHLKKMYKSPNGTIRAALDGTVFRSPILIKGIEPYVRSWKKPITMARHAYGDIYKNSEIRVPGAGTAEIIFTAEDGTVTRKTIHKFSGPGIIQGIHNTDKSIEGFARSCFEYALSVKQDLWFSCKDTISKTYDTHFKEIFQKLYDEDDGDVMSDMMASSFGSLALMTSILVSPAGYFEYEAAHGTVQRHYYKHLKGEKTSTNSVATIFAWL